MPKVSICIPAYERVEPLKRLLKSISEQKYLDFEVIITDNSRLHLESSCIPSSIKDKVNYIHNNPRLGPFANANKSMSLANGEYIKFMFDDDWFSYENSLAGFVKMLDDNPDCSLAFSGSWQCSPKKEFSRCITRHQQNLLKADYRNLYVGNYIGAPSAVIFRNTHKAFDERLKWLVDVELYLSILDENPNFAFTEEPLVKIGVSDSQLTNECVDDKKLISYEMKCIREKHQIPLSVRLRYAVNDAYLKLRKSAGGGKRKILNEKN